MDRRKLLLLALSLAVGVFGWALGESVESLEWLPIVVLPVSFVAMLLVSAFLVHNWTKEHRRKALPGVSIHLTVRVADQLVERRRYFFDLGTQGTPGASFYLSASDRFVFAVEDERGQPYALEIPAGWRGIPMAELGYLSLEAGTDGIRTFLRVSFNGRTVGERTLPFPIAFPNFGGANLGANRRGEGNAAFRAYEVIIYDRTLDHKSAAGMADYMKRKHRIEG